MNKRGIVLISIYLILVVITVVSVGLSSRSIWEGHATRRYNDATNAFWIAEAGMAKAYFTWLTNSNYTGETTNFGSGTYIVTKTASSPQVTVIGTFGTESRTLIASFIRIPHPFENTLSVGGNLSLNGLLARVEVYDKTRISGTYSKGGGASDYFEDKQTGVSPDYTKIIVPDYDDNGTTNEFGDFVQFGRKAVQSYPSDQVVYIQNNGSVLIYPDRDLIGKKVIFVEGSQPGQGNVNILFDATWGVQEDLTIIATGNITYVEPLQYPAEQSRLSMASWGKYTEASIFRSEHQSVIYTQDNADFVDILDWGSTTGNIISNGDMSLREVLTYEKYYYSDRAKNGDLPPGFQWLSGSTGTPYLRNWGETIQ